MSRQQVYSKKINTSLNELMTQDSPQVNTMPTKTLSTIQKLAGGRYSGQRYDTQASDTVLDSSFGAGKYQMARFYKDSQGSISSLGQTANKDWKIGSPPDYKDNIDFQRKLKRLQLTQITKQNVSLSNIKSSEFVAMKYTPIDRKKMGAELSAKFDLLEQVEQNLTKLKFPLPEEPKNGSVLPEPEKHTYFFPMVREASLHIENRKNRGVVSSPFRIDAILSEAKEDYKKKRINIFGRLGDIDSKQSPFKANKSYDSKPVLFQIMNADSPRQKEATQHYLANSFTKKKIVHNTESNTITESPQPKYRSYLQYRMITDSSFSASQSQPGLQIPPLKGLKSKVAAEDKPVWSGGSKFTKSHHTKTSDRLNHSQTYTRTAPHAQSRQNQASTSQTPNPDQESSTQTELRLAADLARRVPKSVFTISRDTPLDRPLTPSAHRKQVLKEVILKNIRENPPSLVQKHQNEQFEGYLESIRQLKREFGYSTVGFCALGHRKTNWGLSGASRTLDCMVRLWKDYKTPRRKKPANTS